MGWGGREQDRRIDEATRVGRRGGHPPYPVGCFPAPGGGKYWGQVSVPMGDAWKREAAGGTMATRNTPSNYTSSSCLSFPARGKCIELRLLECIRRSAVNDPQPGLRPAGRRPRAHQRPRALPYGCLRAVRAQTDAERDGSDSLDPGTFPRSAFHRRSRTKATPRRLSSAPVARANGVWRNPTYRPSVPPDRLPAFSFATPMPPSRGGVSSGQAPPIARRRFFPERISRTAWFNP